MSGTKAVLDGALALEKRPGVPVLIVQGELAYKAALKLASNHYVVLGLPDDRQSYGNLDMSVVDGRNVLIWPYAQSDEVAICNAVAEEVVRKCPDVLDVKILDTKPGDMWGGQLIWDASAAVHHGMKWPDLLAWAKPKVRLVNPRAKAPRIDADPEQAPRVPAVVQTPPREPDEPSFQERAAALEENIQEIQEYVESPVAEPENEEVWTGIGLVLSKGRQPIANVDNALRVLENTPRFKDLVWFDTFHHKYFTRLGSENPREWEDVDDLQLLAYMQRDLEMTRMGLDHVRNAVMLYAHARPRNEPQDWLTGLAWDGEERIPHFFFACFGVPDNEYSRSASRNFWVGMAARILRPGCQLDNMIVLEGPQGVGKTRALRAIGGPWYVEANESVHSKDFYMILRGKLLVEIAEMDSFNRAEVTRIKQVITCTTDTYRAPYDRRVKDHPRQCVFAGTTNEDAYLRDNTGARRFWPIRCRQIDVDRIHELRTQLYAEAVHRFRAGEKWYEMPPILTVQEQEERRQHDEWEGLIYEWLKARDMTTVRELWVEALGGSVANMDGSVQWRISRALKALGWLKRDHRVNGQKAKYWVRAGASPDLPEA